MNQQVCRVEDIPPGGTLAVRSAQGIDILLCNVGGTIHAIENICSHGASALSEGTLLGCEIECALHRGRFDVTTGQATRRPAKRPVATFECSVANGVVYLQDVAA